VTPPSPPPLRKYPPGTPTDVRFMEWREYMRQKAVYDATRPAETYTMGPGRP
jgi:hypothetical protein